MVRNHQGNKQPIEPSLVNQTTSKADYTTREIRGADKLVLDKTFCFFTIIIFIFRGNKGNSRLKYGCRSFSPYFIFN